MPLGLNYPAVTPCLCVKGEKDVCMCMYLMYSSTGLNKMRLWKRSSYFRWDKLLMLRLDWWTLSRTLSKTIICCGHFRSASTDDYKSTSDKLLWTSTKLTCRHSIDEIVKYCTVVQTQTDRSCPYLSGDLVSLLSISSPFQEKALNIILVSPLLKMKEQSINIAGEIKKF